MKYAEIKKFYDYLISERLINKNLVRKIKSISNDNDLKKLIREEIVPLAEGNGYNFTENDLFEYEKLNLLSLSEKDLENVSGGISFRPAVGIMSLALMGISTLAPMTTFAAPPDKPAVTVSSSESQLSPTIINVAKKLSTVESGDRLKSLNSAKEFYDYLKELDSTFTENDFVEFISQLLKTQNPADVAPFIDSAKKLMDEGKTEFEAISQVFDLGIKTRKAVTLDQFKLMFYSFMVKNFMESVDHLSPDGKGVSMYRKSPDMEISKVSKLQQYEGFSRTVDLKHKDLSDFDLREYESLKFTEFGSKTVWPQKDKLPDDFDPEKVLEDGKNPGLGIRSLHEKGIDGNGVGVGIIDSLLMPDHEEYKDSLKLYEEMAINKDMVGDDSNKTAEYHPSAVASIALGKTCGVAPKADLYLIGTDCLGTESMCRENARQIGRILEINKKLPEDKKIRVISISRCYLKTDKDYDIFKAKVEDARKQGVFVIHCTATKSEPVLGMRIFGLARSGDADKSSSYSFGNMFKGAYEANDDFLTAPTLFVPMANRTFAAYTGKNEYTHISLGSLSWTAPWLAGLYALCCQVKPSLTSELFMRIAFETGDILNDTPENTRRDKNNARVVNPQRLIEKLQTL